MSLVCACGNSAESLRQDVPDIPFQSNLAQVTALPSNSTSLHIRLRISTCHIPLHLSRFCTFLDVPYVKYITTAQGIRRHTTAPTLLVSRLSCVATTVKCAIKVQRPALA